MQTDMTKVIQSLSLTNYKRTFDVCSCVLQAEREKEKKTWESAIQHAKIGVFLLCHNLFTQIKSVFPVCLVRANKRIACISFS